MNLFPLKIWVDVYILINLLQIHILWIALDELTAKLQN